MLPEVYFLLLLLCVRGHLELSKNSFPLPVMMMKLNQSMGYALDARKTRRLAELSSPEASPLFQGMGTHYSFIWVGTPPQRVSVIMDTGSHHTAFPCVGCKCGKHMDPFFDPKKSSSSAVKNCGGAKCFFSQAYSEGSSWHAFKVSDKLWLGGASMNNVNEKTWSINFDFGCQDSETGLFRTQNVDGIMGLSAASDTLPYQLMSQKVTTSRLFAMCFKVGGGIFTIGGVDERIHGKIYKPSLTSATSLLSPSFLSSSISLSSSPPAIGSKLPYKIQYAKLQKASGWYTIKLIDILMKNPKDKSIKSIGGAAFKYNAGKGTIVDSGTTDTYLPSAIASNFKSLFQSISGLNYHNDIRDLTLQQFHKLPSIIYRMESIESGKTIDIEVLPTSYMEIFKNNRYANRIYLTEGQGAVLGANFMNEYNVIFDIDNLRVGFVESDCEYSSTGGKFSTDINSHHNQNQNGNHVGSVHKKHNHTIVHHGVSNSNDSNISNSNSGNKTITNTDLANKKGNSNHKINNNKADTTNKKTKSQLDHLKSVLAKNNITIMNQQQLERLHNTIIKYNGKSTTNNNSSSNGNNNSNMNEYDMITNLNITKLRENLLKRKKKNTLQHMVHLPVNGDGNEGDSSGTVSNAISSSNSHNNKVVETVSNYVNRRLMQEYDVCHAPLLTKPCSASCDHLSSSISGSSSGDSNNNTSAMEEKLEYYSINCQRQVVKHIAYVTRGNQEWFVPKCLAVPALQLHHHHNNILQQSLNDNNNTSSAVINNDHHHHRRLIAAANYNNNHHIEYESKIESCVAYCASNSAATIKNNRSPPLNIIKIDSSLYVDTTWYNCPLSSSTSSSIPLMAGDNIRLSYRDNNDNNHLTNNNINTLTPVKCNNESNIISDSNVCGKLYIESETKFSKHLKFEQLQDSIKEISNDKGTVDKREIFSHDTYKISINFHINDPSSKQQQHSMNSRYVDDIIKGLSQLFQIATNQILYKETSRSILLSSAIHNSGIFELIIYSNQLIPYEILQSIHHYVYDNGASSNNINSSNNKEDSSQIELKRGLVEEVVYEIMYSYINHPYFVYLLGNYINGVENNSNNKEEFRWFLPEVTVFSNIKVTLLESSSSSLNTYTLEDLKQFSKNNIIHILITTIFTICGCLCMYYHVLRKRFKSSNNSSYNNNNEDNEQRLNAKKRSLFWLQKYHYKATH